MSHSIHVGARRFVRRMALPVAAAEAFAWHARPGAFERLNPPWEPVRILERHGGIRDGARITLRIGIAPFTLRWRLEHAGYRQDEQFIDRQVRGPFAAWQHVHRFLPPPEGGAGGCVLEDDLTWRAPLGAVGDLVVGPVVERKLSALFRYRQRVTAQDLAAHARHAGRPRLTVLLRDGMPGDVAGPGEPDLLLTLAAYLGTAGHRVWRAVAGGRPEPAISGEIPPPAPPPPPASFDAVLTWRGGEGADAGGHMRIRAGGRAVGLRFGDILLTGHGPLARPLWPWSRSAVAGRMAGRAWIALDDWLGAIEGALHDPSLAGDLDLTAPAAVAAWRRRWPDLPAALDHLLGRG